MPHPSEGGPFGDADGLGNRQNPTTGRTEKGMDSMKRNDNPLRKPHFSDLRRAGDLVFVSGHMALGTGLQVIGTDVAVQTTTCLDHIVRVLATVGLGRADIVKTTVWLVRREDFPDFDAAYGAFFKDCTLPARATVRADLMVPGALVEIEAVAWDAQTR